MNSMKPMLCNNKQTNKTKTKKASAPPPPHTHTHHPPNPCQLTTCTFLPSSRNCRPSSVIHLTVMHLTHRWPPNSLCAESTPTASEVTICLQVACKSGTQDPVLWTALITHLLAFWQARGYATGKGGLRPVTLLLLVSGRGNQRERERDGLA